MATIFLDFDGVLHPNEAYRGANKRVTLRADGHILFEHADRLCELLAPYPTIRVVLSTSWVAVLRSFDGARNYLPPALQAKLVGATWHSSVDRFIWNELTRFEQIQRYVIRHRLTNWLAIDDDDTAWPANQRHRLVHTDEWAGLGDPSIQLVLQDRLSELMRAL